MRGAVRGQVSFPLPLFRGLFSVGTGRFRAGDGTSRSCCSRFFPVPGLWGIGDASRARNDHARF